MGPLTTIKAPITIIFPLKNNNHALISWFNYMSHWTESPHRFFESSLTVQEYFETEK